MRVGERLTQPPLSSLRVFVAMLAVLKVSVKSNESSRNETKPESLRGVELENAVEQFFVFTVKV